MSEYTEYVQRRREDAAERDATLARYAARFPGWRRSRNPNACARVVASKRCRAFGRDFGGSGFSRCQCFSGGYSSVLDHSSLWTTPSKEKVLVAEPYYIEERQYAVFRSDCEQLGLDVWVEPGASPYGYGTYLILVAKNRDSVVSQLAPITKSAP
jgi:hypothetical protein